MRKEKALLGVHTVQLELVYLPLYLFAEGEDYSPINTTLTFNNDERNRRVLFDIIDDLISDGLERFRLELRDREGNIQNDSLVEIVDDESE